jgi:hypothetical protein
MRNGLNNKNMKNTESKINPLLFRNDNLGSRPELVRLKHFYGASYGVIIGLTFAVATWGADGFVLSKSHALLPWLKLIVGAVLCGLIAGLAGWITARIERWYFTIPAWIGVAAFFSWLLIALPLQINPLLSTWFNPQLKSLTSYGSFDQLAPRFWVAFAWIIIFVLIVGVIQIPFIEPAAFSATIFGKIAPFLLGMFIVVINGFVTDSLNNEPLRSAIVSMDKSIQFVVDNRGVDVDPAISRVNHAGSLRGIKEQVTQQRYMTVSGYDDQLGEVRIAVQFEGLLANCTVIYGQPVFCKPVTQD